MRLVGDRSRTQLSVSGYLVALALLGLVGCQESPPAGRGPRQAADTSTGAGLAAPVQAVAPLPASVDSVQRDSLLLYARGLVFDTLTGSSDEQRLTNGQCVVDCKAAPRATIQPQQAAYSATRAELAQGRIVARVINHDTVAFARMNLSPTDTTYWWVDSTAAGWRSTLIPTARDAEMITVPLEIEGHAERRWYQSLARWRTTAQGEVMWTTCGMTGCCKGPPPL